MKELNANTNLNEFPSRIALKGEIFTIDFDSIVDKQYSDNTIKVTHHFLPYISENGTKLQFDKNGVAHKYAGIIEDGRTKFGKKVNKAREDYQNKSIEVVGEIL